MSNNGANGEEKSIGDIDKFMVELLPGTLVVLNTHPYSIAASNKGAIPLIKDFPIIDSPIMVVGESLKNYKDIYDEDTGDLKTKRGSYQSKCIWFNHKIGAFEESWLSSRLLTSLDLKDFEEKTKKERKAKSGDEIDKQKTLDKQKENNEQTVNGIKIGDVVSLRTLPIEKKKLSRFYESRSNPKRYEVYKSTAIHSFEPPVMQVIETRMAEPSQKFDVKSGRKRKFSAEKMLKCKWFNTFLNKFSEAWLPLETLIKRDEPADEELLELNNSIKENQVFQTRDCLFKPTSLNCDGFYWNVEGINLFTNSFQTIGLKQLIGILPISEIKCFPEFHNCNNLKLVENSPDDDEQTSNKKKRRIKAIKSLVEKFRNNDQAIRILYKNLKGKISIRILTDYNFNEEENLLDAYCHLRKAKRKFNILSIKTIESVAFPYKYQVQADVDGN